MEKVKVMIVDDQYIARQLFEMYIKSSEKYKLVMQVDSAALATKALKGNPVDLILMDILMPVMDGLSATRVIRVLDREDAKTIPIIAMTANAFAEDARRSMEAGMNAHLAKPLDMKKVILTIQKCCDNKK